MAARKIIKKTPKGSQAEADRLAALARAYGVDADGKGIAGVGGKVTDVGDSAAARKRALEAAAARAKAQADAAKAAAKSKDKFDPDPETKTGGTGGSGSGSGGLTENERLDNELARLKIQAEYDKAEREAAKVLADAEATREEKAEAKAERERKFAALNKVADIYKTQGEESYKTATGRIDTLYGGQESRLGKNRADSLDSLLKAVSAGKEQIGSAENQFLSSLIKPTAYSDVPLVDLSTTQPVNPLMGALGAEGADTAGVTGQSAMDAALAAQFAQLSRNTAGQLNTGSQNYMAALRNAGTGAAAAGRQELATSQNRYTNDINARFDELANQLAMQRMEALQRADDARNDAALRTAVAQADAAQYAPTTPAPVAAQPPVTAQPPVVAPVLPPNAPVLPPVAPVLPPQYVAGPPPEQGGGRGAQYVAPAPMTPDAEAAMVAAEEARRRREAIDQIVAARRGF